MGKVNKEGEKIEAQGRKVIGKSSEGLKTSGRDVEIS